MLCKKESLNIYFNNIRKTCYLLVALIVSSLVLPRVFHYSTIENIIYNLHNIETTTADISRDKYYLIKHLL